MAAQNKSIIALPLASCHLVDMPDGGIDCSIYNENECLMCPFLGRFATGEGMDEIWGLSHIICFIMMIVVVIIGTFGAFANLLIMIILNRQKTGRGFDTMLIGLAGFDLICSVTSVISAISIVAYFQNWSRGVVNLYIFYYIALTSLFGRSGSSFQTVVITLERYLIVAFPGTTSNWFTVKRARVMVFGVFVFAMMMALPRYVSAYIDENTVGKHMERTKDLDYLIFSTRFEKLFYFDMGGFFDLIDFWAPLPLLLVLNGLIYVHILRFMARRKDLNMKQKKDIRAVKMFLPVIIVLFLCNIVPIVHNFCLVNLFVIRESYMGILISYVVNSAANLPIYYYRGSSFRNETRALLSSVFPFMTKYFKERNGDSETGGRVGNTGTTSGNNSRSNNDMDDNEKY